ncbi:MAG: flp pilus-assembly TadE/G-like family protein [Tetrasphaera sp.]|nr:flp pilus-assembly TadE/G-like family protein [Tetrasphaera sp.]
MAVMAMTATVLIAALLLAQILRARQRASTAGDLAALAGASALVGGEEPCLAAGRVVEAHGLSLQSCAALEDDSVQVRVETPWRGPSLWWPVGSVTAVSRAGPSP